MLPIGPAASCLCAGVHPLPVYPGIKPLHGAAAELMEQWGQWTPSAWPQSHVAASLLQPWAAPHIRVTLSQKPQPGWLCCWEGSQAGVNSAWESWWTLLLRLEELHRDSK